MILGIANEMKIEILITIENRFSLSCKRRKTRIKTKRV